jgi:hypothetical protein
LQELQSQPKAVDKEREWISVENRLPNNSEHDWVLAFIQEDNGYPKDTNK